MTTQIDLVLKLINSSNVSPRFMASKSGNKIFLNNVVPLPHSLFISIWIDFKSELKYNSDRDCRLDLGNDLLKDAIVMIKYKNNISKSKYPTKQLKELVYKGLNKANICPLI